MQQPRGALLKLRDMAMLQMKLTSGMTHLQLAEHFKVSENTVRRALSREAHKELVEQFEDQLIKELVPTAMKAIKDACDNGDAKAALEILKGAGILKKQRDMNRIAEGGDGDSLELYLKVKRDKALKATGEGGAAQIGQTASPEHDSAPTDQKALSAGDGLNLLQAVERAVSDGTLVVQEGQILGDSRDTLDEDGIDA